jgi:hypothetical protein
MPYLFGSLELLVGVAICTGFLLQLWDTLSDPDEEFYLAQQLILLVLTLPALPRVVMGLVLLLHRRYTWFRLRLLECIAGIGCLTYVALGAWGCIIGIRSEYPESLSYVVGLVFIVFGLIGVGYSAIVLSYLNQPRVRDLLNGG